MTQAAVAIMIGPAEWEQIAKVCAYAERRENWGNLRITQSAPAGDNPKHVCLLGDHRCVLSWDRGNDGVLYRRFSVSLVGAERGILPRPFAVKMIAPAFGFSSEPIEPEHGFPAGWMLAKHDDDNCVIVVEAIVSERAEA